MKNKFFSLAMLVSLLAFCLCFTSCGPSAAIRQAPSIEAVTGLYNKLAWLSVNAQSGGNYVIEINADEKVGDALKLSFYEQLSYGDKNNITIILKGIGANRTISHHNLGSIFTVGSGVTLVLDDNITLQGMSSRNVATFEIAYTGPLVKVHSGGTLIMNDGSTITDGINLGVSTNVNGLGGGVSVRSGGTFIMKGGSITKNIVRPLNPFTEASTKQKKAVFQADAQSMGSGVYVYGETNFFGKKDPSGTFTKTGGTITGYASDLNNGNVVLAPDGNPINGFGHAAFFAGEKTKSIDTTIGPEYSFHYSNGAFSEMQNEEPKPKETIAEPEEAIIPAAE